MSKDLKDNLARDNISYMHGTSSLDFWGERIRVVLGLGMPRDAARKRWQNSNLSNSWHLLGRDNYCGKDVQKKFNIKPQ